MDTDISVANPSGLSVLPESSSPLLQSAVGYHHVTCSVCFASVQVGDKNDFHFQKHMQSAACLRAKNSNMMVQSRHEVLQRAEIGRRELALWDMTHHVLFPRPLTVGRAVEVNIILLYCNIKYTEIVARERVVALQVLH